MIFADHNYFLAGSREPVLCMIKEATETVVEHGLEWKMRGAGTRVLGTRRRTTQLVLPAQRQKVHDPICERAEGDGLAADE